MDELAAIPGIGRQTAGNIVVERPYDSVAEVDTGADLRQFTRAGTSGRAD
jgi:radical SAM superfamily enzyme with C-terminal helix-hairpin-helix motif